MRKGEGTYNAVVIGAGAGGLVSAAGLSGLGARVALVEKGRMGGVFSRASIKVLVPLGGFIKRNNGYIGSFGNLNLVMQNTIHQLLMVAHYRALSRSKVMGLGPTQSNSDA